MHEEAEHKRYLHILAGPAMTRLGLVPRLDLTLSELQEMSGWYPHYLL